MPKSFGREKWIEYPRDILLFDPFPGIANGNVQRFVSLPVLRQQMGDERLTGASFSGNRELAAALHRVHRIKEEIQERPAPVDLRQPGSYRSVLPTSG